MLRGLLNLLKTPSLLFPRFVDNPNSRYVRKLTQMQLIDEYRRMYRVGSRVPAAFQNG